MPDLRRERRYAVVLLIFSVVLLAAGTLVRRRFTAPDPQPQPPDLERLQRLSDERRLRELSAYLADVASSHTRRLLAPVGLVWNAHAAVAPVAAKLAGFTPVPASGGAPFRVWRSAADTGLAAPPPARLKPGDWVLAVAPGPDRRTVFAHGMFHGITKQSCGTFVYDAIQSSAGLSPALVGGAVFALDGGLAGFVAECEGRPIVIAASTISEVVAHPPSEREILEQRYGFRLASDPPAPVLSVWADSLAAQAGIHPGDIVEPGDGEMTVRRGGKPVSVSRPSPPAAVRGISFDAASSVRAIEPGSAAEHAFLEPAMRSFASAPPP